MRQDIFSGFFLDSGVKKFATALPSRGSANVFPSLSALYVLVVVDCCFRFDGGGETPLSLELGRFFRPGRSTILKRLCSEVSVDWIL